MKKAQAKSLNPWLSTNILRHVQFLNKDEKSSGKILESYMPIKILHSISQLVKERWKKQTNKQTNKKKKYNRLLRHILDPYPYLSQRCFTLSEFGSARLREGVEGGEEENGRNSQQPDQLQGRPLERKRHDVEPGARRNKSRCGRFKWTIVHRYGPGEDGPGGKRDRNSELGCHLFCSLALDTLKYRLPPSVFVVFALGSRI